MVYEFEGRTEKEAIDRATETLGLEKDDFDVEILETRRSGLFIKGYVKIKVHTNELVSAHPHEAEEPDEQGEAEEKKKGVADMTDKTPERKRLPAVPLDTNSVEQRMITFLEGLIERMGYSGAVSVMFREERKIGFKIDSDFSPILIGKKGKNLDALQLIANIYAGRMGREDLRIILDAENYRIRREETLVRLAYTVADRVRENRNSVLLEPMNPFDRRLIHTTLNDISDVETKSEGDGLYKQVRVYYRGGRG
ncbi:MAG: protein jag [Spirochaetaceae bacterium]|jgi:spoIIIJ-associated protein|nr:protein jag [Spirochaetaceae bacterium]